MKILLIYPSHLDKKIPYIPKNYLQATGIYPPLGLLYISSSLKKRGFDDTYLLDCQFSQDEVTDVLRTVSSLSPHIVGISTTTFTLHKSLQIATAIKSHRPSLHINFGWAHPAFYPRETLSFPCVDSITIGEGEETFPELATALAAGTPLDTVRGIGFKNNGDIILTPPRKPIVDLDSLPFPERSHIRGLKYDIASGPFPNTTVLTSRGCPYKCIFCYTGDKIIRYRSHHNVVDEMEMLQEMGYKLINFMDNDFTVNRERIMAIFQEILKRRLTIPFTCASRVDGVDEEMLLLAKEAGIKSLAFGIEAGTNESLTTLQKGFTVEQAREAVALCKKIGISLCLYFVVGVPYETRKQLEKTIRFAIDLDPDFVQFLPLFLTPGTALYKMALEAGAYKNDFFYEYAKNPRVPLDFQCWETTVTLEEIERYLKLAYRKFYFRWSFLKRVVLKTPSLKLLLRRGTIGLGLMKYLK